MGFVGVLAVWNYYTFVDVTLSRSLPESTVSNVRTFESWGAGARDPGQQKARRCGGRAATNPDVDRTYHDLTAITGRRRYPPDRARPKTRVKMEAPVQNEGERVLTPLLASCATTPHCLSIAPRRPFSTLIVPLLMVITGHGMSSHVTKRLTGPAAAPRTE